MIQLPLSSSPNTTLQVDDFCKQLTKEVHSQFEQLKHFIMRNYELFIFRKPVCPLCHTGRDASHRLLPSEDRRDGDAAEGKRQTDTCCSSGRITSSLDTQET